MYQRYGDQRGRLGGDPQQPQVPGLMASAQQPQQSQECRHKHPVRPLRADAQVGHAIDGAHQKEQRNGGEHGAGERIKAEPRRRSDDGRVHQHPKNQRRVQSGKNRQQQGPGAFLRPGRRHNSPHQRNKDQQQFVHSRSTLSLRVSSESNARWMRSTMMPMTNTAAIRSRRMPDSTSSGVEWIRSMPNK